MLVSFDGWSALLFLPLSLSRSLSALLPLSVIRHEGHRLAVQSEHAALLPVAPPVCVTSARRLHSPCQRTYRTDRDNSIPLASFYFNSSAREIGFSRWPLGSARARVRQMAACEKSITPERYCEEAEDEEGNSLTLIIITSPTRSITGLTSRWVFITPAEKEDLRAVDVYYTIAIGHLFKLAFSREQNKQQTRARAIIRAR